MARPPQEAIDTFISITGADEAVAVRKLEVPPKGLTFFPFHFPPVQFRIRNLAKSVRLVVDLVALGRALDLAFNRVFGCVADGVGVLV